MTNDLTHLRGMSDPFGFTFNVLDKGKKLLVHAVIFTSYEVEDDDRLLHLPEPDCDPRMKAFVDFCIANYGKKAKDVLKAEIEKMANELSQLDKQIVELKRELKHVQQ